MEGQLPGLLKVLRLNSHKCKHLQSQRNKIHQKCVKEPKQVAETGATAVDLALGELCGK